MVDFDKIKLIDIVPAEYNPRSISDDELEKLSNSIDEFGLVDPIIINLKNNKIIGGHQRYEVLLNQHMNNGVNELNLLKLGDVGWVFTEDDLKIKSDEHEKALNLALNKISGEWDFDKLDIVLDELALSDFDVSLTGFDDLELDDFGVEPEVGEKFDNNNLEKLYDDDEDDEEDEWRFNSKIVFDNPVDEDLFYKFIENLKENYNGETITEKLLTYFSINLENKIDYYEYSSDFEFIFKTEDEKQEFVDINKKLKERYSNSKYPIVDFIKEFENGLQTE